MSFTYVKSRSADFLFGVSAYQLKREIIAAGVATCTLVNVSGDVVTLYFSADYTASTAVIDSTIADHRVNPDCFDDLKFVTITSGPYQMTVRSVYANTSGGNITVKLPRPQRANKFIFAVQNISTGVVTVAPYASELIDGASSVVLSNYKSYLLVISDGTNWSSVSSRVDASSNAEMSNTTTKGDIRIDDGAELQVLSVGTDGSVLTADSTQPLGIRWGVVGGSSTNCTEVAAVSVATTTSTSYVVLITTTPAAGTYLAMFSSTVSSSSASANIYFALHTAGTVVTSSERMYRGATSTTAHVYTQAKITVNGSQAIEVRYKTSAGTATIGARNLILVAVV